MPLLDHFHPPLSQQRHWDSFHSAWAEAMAIHLNQCLPNRFFAEARVTAGNRIEIDVATFDEEDDDGSDDGKVWAPPRPQVTVPLDFSEMEEFEVQVLNDEEGPRLVAAVELVSPANKDRPSHRRMFVAKCAAYLQKGINVMIVDVVTGRKANLQAALYDFLQLSVTADGLTEGQLYATAFRTRADLKSALHLDIWNEVLAIGSDLPTLPMWIQAEQCVPLNLEATYRMACANRRIAV